MFDNLLLPSIKKQSFTDYEIIEIDTIEHPYKSAAEALNFGASKAKGDVLLFVHQDVELLDEDVLKKINDFATSNDFGVCGVAGVNIDTYVVYSSVIQGKKKEVAGTLIDKVKEIDVLDECLFFIKKSEFREFKDYGSGHFYAVERCLDYKKHGYHNFILPLDIYHVSPGYSLNKSYWKTLLEVARDYPELEYITTTMGNFRNDKNLKLKVPFISFKKRVASIIKRR